MSVGKFCTKGNNGCAIFLRHEGESCGTKILAVLVDRVRNLSELPGWIKLGNVLAPVGSACELAEHLAAAPHRADAEILMDAQPQEAHARRVDTKNTLNLRSFW